MLDNNTINSILIVSMPIIKIGKDTSESKKIELAKFYEDQNEYDKALKIYLEEINSKKDNVRKEAFNGVRRTEKEINSLCYKVKEIISKPLDIIWYFILYSACILILIKGIKYLLLLRHKILKYKGCLIEVKPLVNSSSTNVLFTHFKAYIDWYIYRMNRSSELKKRIYRNEILTAKPTMRTKEISTLAEITIKTAAPQLSSLFSKYYNYLVPVDYCISGYINFVNDDIRNLVIYLKNNRKVLKMWEKEIETKDFMSELKLLAFEILMFIEHEKNN